MRILLAIALLVLLVVEPASAQASRRLWGTGKEPRVRPGQILLSGDGSEILGGDGWTHGTGLSSFGRVAWTTYNGREAIGTGLLWIDDCDPFCAEGTYHQHVATVHAFSVSRNVYRRLTIRYSDGGVMRTDRRVLHHFAGWSWDDAR